MKKSLCILISLFFIFGFYPAYSEDLPSSFMSLDEYSNFFEMGFMDDENEEDTENKTGYVPKLKEKMEVEGDEVITLESVPYKIKIEKRDFLDSYREVLKPIETKNELYKKDGFSLFTDGKKELSDYMTDDFKSTMNVSYNMNEKFSLTAGHEIWYVNPDASIGAKKFYFNPRLNITKNVYLDYVSKYNHTSSNLEQEVGLNFKPKIFNNNASFGVKASTVIDNQTRQIESKKIKFSTDFYIY